MTSINRVKILQLVKDMDVPEQRKTDIHWLKRNLGIRNSNHPNFNQVIALIHKELKQCV